MINIKRIKSWYFWNVKRRIKYLILGFHKRKCIRSKISYIHLETGEIIYTHDEMWQEYSYIKELQNGIVLIKSYDHYKDGYSSEELPNRYLKAYPKSIRTIYYK